MLGAITGDIIGSCYESHPIKTKDFPLFSSNSVFSDDTVLTVATADALLIGKNDFSSAYQRWAQKYPRSGFGGGFQKWMWSKNLEPYLSFGNGSAMRVSPVAWAAGSLDAVLDMARKSAEVTHNHPEGIKGAQAVAAALYLAREQKSKSDIREYVTENFGYDLSATLDEIRSTYSFDITCQGSVPEAITAFCESTDFEDCIRNAVSLGGDSDTLAAMAGSIAEAFYGGIPEAMRNEVMARLPGDMNGVISRFEKKYYQI